MKYFNETYIKRRFVTRNDWADTYKAIHSSTEEKVTLKVLVRKSNDEEYINNLLKEVEILKNIKNPNLINVNNMFQYSGCGKIYYYVEGEYFKGISLEEKLQSGKLEEEEAIKIVETVAQGLKEFHNRNILFNNLSLSNVFINSKEVVKTDVLSYLENKKFVVLSHDETKETEETVEIKIEKKVEEIRFNPQKDIHDLGVILYELLTGNLSFDSNNYKRQISNANLVSIVEKATNSNLENKYNNINRFLVDLKSYSQYGVLSEESYDAKEEVPNKKKRKKGKVGKALGVCAVIALVGGACVYGYDIIEKHKKDEEANATKIEETTKPKEEEKKVEEKKEDKTEEYKTVKPEKKDDKSTDKSSYTSKSKKNNSSTTSSKKNNNSSSSSSNSSNKNSNNSSSNNTSKPNKPSKPSKPSNNGGSDNTTHKPDNGTGSGDKDTEVKPPSNESNNSNSGSENEKPESSGTETE
ncbi:protein kinase family protein [Terrisporobacter petrolearius]|uniref:protein kinase family protein n=1 Tax=Terrisporobacter petrolearius TaxID=1460447 RepID=UPI001D168B6E|nr:protein kinase family protein [Terrisporobacter petrolearius]MCC3863104.1 protein kinase family protein [Terrisporobacter petrolearius]